MKWSVKMQPLLESQQKLRRKDNMRSFLLGFPHCSRQLCSPWAWENNSAHPRQKYTGRKEISRHKGSLCNAVKLHWFFFPSVYLTDNMKSLLHVMSRWALGITLALPILLISLVKMCLGQGIVERPWVWVTHLYKVSAFMQRHIARLLKVNPKTEWLLCPTLRST